MLKNNGNNKHRMTYIDSIMKDPNLSKLIFEASSAPLGSTKRKQAKSTINIIKRSDKNNYFGKGGPGFDGQGGIFDGIKNFLSGNKKKAEASTAPTTRPAPVQGPMQGPSLPENKIIFPAAPEIKNNFLKTSGTKPQTKINQITSGFMNTISPIIGGKDKKDLYADYKLSPQNNSDYGYKLGELGKQPSLSNLDGVTLNKNIKDIEKEAGVGSIKDQRKIKRGSIREQRDDKRETIREINQEIARLNNQLSFSAGNAINSYGGLSGNNQNEEIYRKIQFLNEKKKEVKSGFKESRDDIKDTFKENKRNIKSGNYLSLGSNKESGTTGDVATTETQDTTKQETTGTSDATNTGTYDVKGTPTYLPSGVNFDDDIVKSLIQQESGGKYNSKDSPEGAMGKYQIMPLWLKEIGLNPDSEADKQKFRNSPELQDQLFGIIIDDLSQRYNGDAVKMLAAYYGGGYGARVVGTPEGDKPQKGFPSINQYVASILSRAGVDTGDLGTGTWTGGSSTGSEYGQADTSGGGSLDMEQAAAMAKQFSDAGYGKEAFAEYMMSLGGSVSDKTKRLAQTLYDEYDLEQKANRLSEMNEMSPNIERDIIDYIRSRDKYVNSINYQLDTLAETYASTDTSNPYTEQMFQNYKNYLITIKGRQNKRYTQYVTDSVNSFKTDLERIKNDYDSTKKSYDEALKSGTKMLEEEAQQRIKMFEGLYEAQEELPERTLRLSKLQSEVNKVNLETVYGYTAYGQGKGFLTGEAKDLIIDSKTGNVKQGVSLTSIIDQLSVEGGDVHPADVINTFSGGVINELNFLSKSNPSEAIIKGQQYINDMSDAIGQNSRLPEATKQELYTRLIEPLKVKIISTIIGTNDPSKENPDGLLGFFKKNYSTVKSASKDLSEGDRSWFLGSKKPISKDDFIKKYKSKLGQELSDAFYESDKIYKNNFDGETILDELQARIEANKEVPKSGSGVFFAELPEETQLAYILSLRVGEAINYFNE